MRIGRRTAWGWAAALQVAALLAGGARHDSAFPLAPTAERSCRVCHPGPTEALAAGPHGGLLAREDACSTCHEDADAHARSALDPRRAMVLPAAVRARACAQCHEGEEWSPARAAHPWRREDAREPSRHPGAGSAPVVVPAPAPPAAATPRGTRVFGLDWTLRARAGHRFVSRWGSRDRFATDLDLAEGPRLLDLELEGRTDDPAPVQRVRVYARDVDDPTMTLGAEAAKEGLYEGAVSYTKTDIKLRTSGDFHRLDRKTQETAFHASLEATENVSVFVSHARTLQDGFWLTNRIGNRNVTPITSIDGVRSPREFDAERTEFGVTGEVAATAFSIAAAYRDENERERWAYSRPAPLNPTFPESEDFLSRSTLRGPELRVTLGREFGPVSLDMSLLHLDLDRRILGAGVKRGFDIGAFTTTTDTAASGDAVTWVVEATAALELHDRAALVVDARWHDHRERMRIFQSDVTVYPASGTTTTSTLNRVLRTTQRALDAAVRVDLRPLDSLDVSVGYGMAREWLTVPDLEAGDPDFHSGLIQNDGILLDLTWRPAAGWTLDGRWREFGQNGIQLHDIVDDESRRIEASLAHRGDHHQAQVFVRHRRRANDVSRTLLRATTAGIHAGVFRGEDLDVHAGYVYSDLSSRTLTNFYFDPDPNPVPTFVGFRGDTHTLTAGIGLRPSAGVRWRFDVAWTGTNGSFDVHLLDWRGDLSVDVVRGGRAGFELRQVHYAEEGGADDYGAVIGLVYWRQRL